MKNIKIFDRRVGFSLGALSVLFGVVAPAALPAFASADSQITSRSISMSSTAPTAPATTYKVTFTPNESASDYVAIELCQSTPLMAAACDVPTGADMSGASTSPGTASDKNHNYIIAPETLVATTPITVTVSGVTNPTTVGAFYAKIAVFDTQAHAEAAVGDGSSDATGALPSSTTGLVDDGSVALSIDNTVGVQAAVLESLTFCVMGDANNRVLPTDTSTNDVSTALTTGALAANAPTSSCQQGTAKASPNVILGKTTGSVTALSTSEESYQLDWAQISTNASSGAVVYLKSSLACAGLSRNAGTDACADIPAPGNSTTPGALGAGTAGFGFSFGAAQSPSDGTLDGTVNVEGSYGSGAYNQLDSGNGATGDFTGLPLNTTSSSSYGGAVLSTGGAPISDANVPVGVAASISNNTRAGLYQASYNMIAVGTF